jgi:hypothetical protein
VTGNNFLTLEVAPISNHGKFLNPHGGTGLSFPRKLVCQG